VPAVQRPTEGLLMNQGRSGESVMGNRADIYRQKAHECDRAATRVADPQMTFQPDLPRGAKGS
jgi:hypothetical protein